MMFFTSVMVLMVNEFEYFVCIRSSVILLVLAVPNVVFKYPPQNKRDSLLNVIYCWPSYSKMLMVEDCINSAYSNCPE